MAARKFQNATRTDSTYERDVVKHPDKYTTYWGTRSQVAQKTTWSIKHARHPIIAWLGELSALAQRTGTNDEWVYVQTLLAEVKELKDFSGVKQWSFEVAGMKVRASICRL